MSSIRMSVLCFLTIAVVSVAIPSFSEAPADPRSEGMDMELVQQVGALFKGAMTGRHGTKESPKRYMGSMKVQRAVFLKTQGCAKGTFTISENLPKPLKIGLFAKGGEKPVYVRISSDTAPDTPDQKNSTIGIALKVLDVPGKKILPDEESFTTHDFLLQNHPVFFVDNFRHFLLLFTDPEQIKNEPNGEALLAKYNKILDVDMAKDVQNVLEAPYWSTTPYKFGNDQYAKYKVVPCSTGFTTQDDDRNPNYLAARMKKDFGSHGACFDFQVQVRSKDKESTELLEKSTEEWGESQYVPVTVARITIPPQDISKYTQKCEDMSFTAWHALPEHQPLGSINKGRGYVYKAMADYRRHERNGIAIEEPKD